MKIFKPLKFVGKWIGSTIRSKDTKYFKFIFDYFMTSKYKTKCMFSKPISLTSKGEESFSTLIGGIVSIAIIGLLMTFGTVKFMAMIYRSDSNTSFNNVVNDLIIKILLK